MRVSDVLRAAMVRAERRGVSLYRIAKECELDDSIVYRFYHDECGLALTSVDRLCNFLDLRLVDPNQPLTAQEMVEQTRSKKKAAKKAAKGASSNSQPTGRSKAAAKKRTTKKTPKKKAAKRTVKKSAKKKPAKKKPAKKRTRRK